MAAITELRKTKRGRIAVYVDGEFALTVDSFTAAELGLKAGDEVDDGRLTEMLRESSAQRAKTKALNLLSARSYTKRQLTEKLEAATTKEAADEAVARMEELGLVDDRDYALRYARELYELKSFAPRRIRFELAKRGIGPEEMEEALAQFDKEEGYERAKAYIFHKYGRLSGERERARASAALSRLGYGYDEIRYALKAASSGELPDVE